MPKMHISRTKTINAPYEKVHSILADMSQWQAWSPWLISEPEAKVEVRADNKFYTWTGSRVGQGQMHVINESADQIDYNLTFLKPWKSQAKVSMKLKESQDGTNVTWTMDSKLPIFMFWMKKMMEAFVGNDYDRGLNLLKDYSEDGKVHSQLNHLGIEHRAPSNFVSIKRSCSMEDMPKYMEVDFTKLMTVAHNMEGFRPQDAFCMYNKWDMVKKQVSYTAAVPYEGPKPELSFEHTIGQMPSTKVYTLEHVGPYQHLGNAWATLYMMQRNKEIKVKKGIHPFETYRNSPKDTAPKDLITRIHFPVKD